jgi:hypothetical protein
LPTANESLLFLFVIVPANEHCLPSIDCCNQEGVADQTIMAADETKPKELVGEIQPWPHFVGAARLARTDFARCRRWMPWWNFAARNAICPAWNAILCERAR